MWDMLPVTRVGKIVVEHSHVEDQDEDENQAAVGILGKQIVRARTGLNWRSYALVL